MANYFHVTGGVIDDGPRALPTSWRNVSGFNLLPDADLKPLGWLLEEQVGYEPFDPDSQVREGPVVDIQADKVVCTYAVRAKTAQEIADEQEARTDADVGAEPIREALVDTLLDFENRLRVLESRAPVDRATARTVLKNRIKADL